jgi:cytochrome c551/c552
MKKSILSVAVVAVLALASLAFTQKPATEKVSFLQDQAGITFPENVKTIIDAKCMGCHKPDSRNTKAKEKLQWADVPKMNKEDQEHLIDELFEVLEEGKMPPKKVLERRPQMKLTDEETKTLLAWAEAEEKRLKGE